MARRTPPVVTPDTTAFKVSRTSTTTSGLVAGQVVTITSDGGKVPDAESLFRDSIENKLRRRDEANEAQERANEAEREAHRAEAWHRFAREQYLNRTFYQPETEQTGYGPVWTYDYWLGKIHETP